MGSSVAKPTAAPESKYWAGVRNALPRMDGKNVAITGCTSGMGFVLAKACAELGARIIMLNRPSERANAALKKLTDAGHNAILVACDLSKFDSVRAAGEELRKQFSDTGIDVLCNNAGVMGLPNEATADGYDVQMQCNHLSHFLLVAEIWPLLEKALALRGDARVVNHSR
jgi:NAD(P)-dependent dehydrogenase (short-subunit alcohol dehydrogenase family)